MQRRFAVLCALVVPYLIAWQLVSGIPSRGQDPKEIPPSFVNATSTLFAQGLADPRGGEYRAFTVLVGNVWRGNVTAVETHGWLLPGRRADGQQLAVCWNGLVYPVAAVKGRADLKSDIDALTAKQREQSKKYEGQNGFGAYSGRAIPEDASISFEHPSLLSAAYLLRLGENDLARTIYDLWDTGTSYAGRNGHHDPYLDMAAQWAWATYDRAVCAHMRGADPLVVADTELLTRIQPEIENEASKRGYATFPNGSIHQPGSPYLPFLENLPALRQDALRRVAAKQTPPSPFDAVTLKKLPQNQRIARLIRHMDEIDARQSGQPGGVGLDDHPISELLIAEGDAAIEPLLNVMENDDRLTRSVSFGRDFFPRRNLLTVGSAAFACFARITGLTEIGKNGDGAQRSVDALRAWWAANKAMSPADRWFAQLADESGVDRTKRWSEAASRILERSDVQRHGMWVSLPEYSHSTPLPPFKGESLRQRQQSPSVSDLLRKRALSLSEPKEGKWGFDYAQAATFALMLYEWEPGGHETLPTLATVMKRCLDFQYMQPRGEGSSDQYQLGGRIARLTLARIRLSDETAADAYGTWLRSAPPEYSGFETRSSLLALWMAPDDPALRRVADALFEEPHGRMLPNDWNDLLTDPKSRGNYYAGDLLASDMIRLPRFRDMVVRRLKDTTEAGSVTRTGAGTDKTLRFAWNEGASQSGGTTKSETADRQTLRLCDRCALALQRLAGVPRFDPLAPATERDKQCAAITAYLHRYGLLLGRTNSFSPMTQPLYGYNMGAGLDYLGPTFPTATRPATNADVRANRAIFTLSGDKVRIVANLPAPFPLEAQWNSDPDGDFAKISDGKKSQWSHGFIWQAEEVYEGQKWVRYYGYVGPHSIVRVPATEIQINDHRVSAMKLPPETAGASKPMR